MSKKTNGTKALTKPVEAEPVDLSVVAPDPATLVERVDASWLKGIKVERIISLSAGDGVRGVFRGKGPLVEVNDPVTGEVRELDTWRIEVKPGIIGRLLDSAQLKREFAQMETGTKVKVIKLGQVNTRAGRRVNDFIVGVES